MFLLMRKFADKPRKQRERMRAAKGKALVTGTSRCVDSTRPPRSRAHRWPLRSGTRSTRKLRCDASSPTAECLRRMARWQAIGRSGSLPTSSETPCWNSTWSPPRQRRSPTFGPEGRDWLNGYTKSPDACDAYAAGEGSLSAELSRSRTKRAHCSRLVCVASSCSREAASAASCSFSSCFARRKRL